MDMEPCETQEFDHASGTSIFWALVALALNTMTEPPRTGIFFQSGPGTTTNFNPGFDPLRSSPVLCSAEIVLDIFFFFIVKQKPHTIISDAGTDDTTNAPNTTELRPLAGGQNPEVLPDPALATTHHAQPSTDDTASSKSRLKVLAFLLGVLPQAIKLFSMRGIVGTQICAAIFLAASVVRAIISCKSSSHFAASIDILKNIETYTVPRLLLALFTLIAHYVIYIRIYFNIVVGLSNNTAAAASASDRSVNILSEVATWARIFYMFFALLTVLFNLVWRHSLTRFKFFPLFLSIVLPPLDEGFILPRHMESATLTQAVRLFMLSLLSCLLVSALFISSGRFLSRLATKRVAHSGGHSDGSLPATCASADEPGSMRRFHVTDTLRQGLIWLKAVFVGLCRALDNHGEWLGTLHKRYSMSTESIILAYGIFNLLTAVLYYLVAFDTTGTSSPLWNSVLG